VSRSLADRLRRRSAGDDGFGLVEIIIAMMIFAVVTIATAPLFVGGLKAGRAAQLHLQGKSLTQERLEKMRNLPYHVARQNGQYLDVLDIYFRDLQANGALSAGDVCSTRTYAAATSTYTCRITALGTAYPGFSQVVSTQFIDAARAVKVPPATYTSQTAGVDAPVSNLLSTTVVTSWTQAGKTRTFSLRSFIANAQADPNVINASLRASAFSISSNMSTGDVLELEAGLVSSEGALNTGSTAGLSVAAARGGLASGVSATGASLSLSAPPAATGSSPSAGGTFLQSSCAMLCFGDTAITGAQTADVTSGLPKVSASANQVTATLKRTGTGSFKGFSYSNADPSVIAPALLLDPTLPMVSAYQAAGGSTVASASAYLDATGSGASAVKSSSTVAVNELDLFPTTFISGGRGLVRVVLSSATLACQSGGGATSVTANWAGQVGYWSSAIDGYVYYGAAAGTEQPHGAAGCTAQHLDPDVDGADERRGRGGVRRGAGQGLDEPCHHDLDDTDPCRGCHLATQYRGWFTLVPRAGQPVMARRRRNDDAGFTLVEMIVSMTIFGVLLLIVLTTVTGTRRSTETVRQVTNLNEEARLAVNRITRELRQASEITAVSGTDGASGLTFGVDFNGNGTLDDAVADPERLTYRWDGQRILLSAADSSGTTVTQPILSGEVSAFALAYRSSKYEYDCNGDGVTTWQELDAASCGPAGNTVGNGNGVLDAGELPYVDSVVLSFTVLDGSRRQDYRTQIDMRNAL
jgi:prepilin-type N-terminal cleavage/methylation domain-containing protein